MKINNITTANCIYRTKVCEMYLTFLPQNFANCHLSSAGDISNPYLLPYLRLIPRGQDLKVREKGTSLKDSVVLLLVELFPKENV